MRKHACTHYKGMKMMTNGGFLILLALRTEVSSFLQRVGGFCACLYFLEMTM